MLSPFLSTYVVAIVHVYPEDVAIPNDFTSSIYIALHYLLNLPEDSCAHEYSLYCSKLSGDLVSSSVIIT